MFNAMGLINLYEEEGQIRELTVHRPLAAVPFGGRYRLIDFILSNLVNSGIKNIGILVQNKYRALTDHLRSGKEWDLARKRDGLFILPPANIYNPTHREHGDVENFYHHLDYIQSSRQQYVVISGSSILCNIDFREVFNYHVSKRADITLVYKNADMSNDYENCTIIDVGPDKRVLDIQVNSAKKTYKNISMNMYIMDKALLIDLIDSSAAHGGSDFVIDCLLKNICKYKIYAYPYQGYMARVHSINSYYKGNMELLSPPNWKELFFNPGLIYTKVKDAAPAIYKEHSNVQDTLVANGCVIEGDVRRSILFRSVQIGKNACIKNSIIMQKSVIGEGAVLENVICDKNVVISSGKNLKGDKNYPLVIKKGTVI